MNKRVFTMLTALALGYGGCPVPVHAEEEGQDVSVAKTDTVVTTVEGLNAALNDTFQTIYINADTLRLTSSLSVNRSVVIEGNGVVMTPNGSWSTSSANGAHNLINIIDGTEETGETVLRNVTVYKSNRNGICAQTKRTTKLEYVYIYSCAGAGLTVTSEVEALHMNTFYNEWGGVNIDKTSDTANKDTWTPSFKYTGSLFAETYGIYSDNPNDNLTVESTDEELTSGEVSGKKVWLPSDYSAENVDELEMAVAIKVPSIYLFSGTYELSKQLVIDYPVAINGDSEGSTIITAKTGEGLWTGEGNSTKNLISIGGATNDGDVSLSFLIVEGSVASGINAQANRVVNLRSVVLRNNTNAGLLVHGEVNAYGLKTMNNGWGGVNIDKGSTEYGLNFSFDEDCSFAENSKIWSEITDDEEIIEAPKGWTSYVVGEGKDAKRYWIPETNVANPINIVYSTGANGTVKIAYGDKPAASYAQIPGNVETIKVVAVPNMGYKVSDESEKGLSVEGATAVNDSIFSVTEGQTLAISVEFVKDENKMSAAVTEVSNKPSVATDESNVTVEAEVPAIIDTESAFADSNVKVVAEKSSEEEAANIVKAYNEQPAADAIDYDELVAFEITPMVVSGDESDKTVGEATLTGEVAVAFAYPAGVSASDVAEVKALHLKDDGTIEELKATPEAGYIKVSGIKSFSTILAAITMKSSASVTTYYDLNLIKSEGAKLVSRHGKMRAKAGSSFTLSLEKEAGYEDCQPTVFVKRGRFGSWEVLNIDEVSGYYQIRNVQSDIWVKVSGDGIWAVANEDIQAQEARAYAVDGKVVVVAPQPVDVIVVTMAGSVVANEQVSGQREFANLPAGVYIVRIGEEAFKLNVR